MSHADFLKDRRALRDRADWWIEITITSPSGVPTTLRYSRRGTRNGSSQISLNSGADIVAAHERFDPRLILAPTLSSSMWREGAIFSSSLPTYGPLVLNNGDRFLDQYSPKEGWQWTGGRCRCYFFDNADISGTIGKIFDGRLGQPSYSLAPQIEIPLYGRESDFDRPLSSRVYRGTSYALELVGDKTVTFGIAPPAVNLRNDLTLEAWLYLEALNTGLLVFWGLVGTGPWRLVLNAARQLALFVSVGGASQSATMSKVLAARTFYHVAVVVSGRDVIFYVWDDAAQVLTTETFLNAYTVFTRDTTTAGIGYQYRSGSDATLKIWMDESRVWNYARSSVEISADRFRPLNTSIPASCVHRVGYDDGTGTTATDSSASALHGSIAGAGTHTWLWVLEGGPELAGTPKPDTIGHKFGVRPVLVDPLRNTWQVHHGSVQSIQSSEGGSSHTMSATAATLRTLITTTPVAPNSLPYLAGGYFKLSATTPVLPVSAIVEGANDGHLGYVETCSKVSRYIAVLRGPRLGDPADIDTASYTNYESGFNPAIGITYYERQSAKDGMDLALRSSAGWWGFLRGMNQLHIEKYIGPAASPDYTYKTREGHANETQILDIQEWRTDQIIYEVEVRYHYNDVVMTEDQVAAGIKGTTSWTQWTRPYLHKIATDETLKTAYEGKSGRRLIVETGIWSDSDAQTLANYLLGKLKGPKIGYRVTLTLEALQAELGDTEALAFQYQDGTIVLGLDGDDNYVVVSANLQPQQGQVIHEVMP